MGCPSHPNNKGKFANKGFLWGGWMDKRFPKKPIGLGEPSPGYWE